MTRILLASVLTFVLASTVSADDQAQPAPSPVVLCKTSLQCLQQMVDDLRDYRVYLEDQLSLAKSLLAQANQRIAAQLQEIAALKAAAKPPDPPAGK